ncbi:Lysosome-associated membrane glycoprotein 1 [Papilio machaon]|uniref:Lysosome-associated membrane glycoprotein 5 n=1 Tax=Papilio machaon TaxID=76193 RepID=A0A194R631_PAPMA|nr:Lysosome-associated membrane glycoprotein 1 [Papilio machaon]
MGYLKVYIFLAVTCSSVIIGQGGITTKKPDLIDLPASVAPLKSISDAAPSVDVIGPSHEPQQSSSSQPDTTTASTTSTTRSITTTSTPAPITTTESAPNTTTVPTTTVTPAPEPKPTPAPGPLPRPTQGTWFYTDQSTNVTCILVQFAAQLNITYPKNNTSSLGYALLNVPANASVVDGNCNTTSQQLTLAWADGNHTLTMHFLANDTTKTYLLNSLNITISPEILVNSSSSLGYALLNVPANASVVDGNCNTTSQQLTLAWADGNHTLTMHFLANDTTKTYLLNSLNITISPEILVNSSLSRRVEVWHGAEWAMPLNTSYRCAADTQLNLTAEVTSVAATLTLSQLQEEAFRTQHNNNSFSSARECGSPDLPDAVPIAVGCALGGLVVVVLIAYLEGRRRSAARGYLSIGNKTRAFRPHGNLTPRHDTARHLPRQRLRVHCFMGAVKMPLLRDLLESVDKGLGCGTERTPRSRLVTVSDCIGTILNLNLQRALRSLISLNGYWQVIELLKFYFVVTLKSRHVSLLDQARSLS